MPETLKVEHWATSPDISYQAALQSWFEELLEQVQSKRRPLSPAMKSLEQTVESDSTLSMLCSNALLASSDPKSTGLRIRDAHHLFELMNALLDRAPEFHESGALSIIPFGSLFSCLPGKEAAASLLLHPEWNRQLTVVLDEWSRFLTSGASCSVLNTDPLRGWLGEAALAKMPNFVRDFACAPAQPHWGYRSWDDFFTRSFRPGARPVDAPDDNATIVNACESAPYKLAHGIQQTDMFWLKGYAYSLQHMLASEALAQEFVGGTIYQGLLSAFNYHRWHSPVNGRIQDAYVINGANYWAATTPDVDIEHLIDSQAHSAHLATRAVILIETDHPAIGLMCVLAVGMLDVASCDLTVQVGQTIRKGEQLGMFHFGGSTHCLLFKPGVQLDFDLHGQVCGLQSENIPVNATLAHVRTGSK